MKKRSVNIMILFDNFNLSGETYCHWIFIPLCPDILNGYTAQPDRENERHYPPQSGKSFNLKRFDKILKHIFILSIYLSLQ